MPGSKSNLENPQVQLAIIRNLEESGITDVDYSEIIDNMQVMFDKYTLPESGDEAIEFEYEELSGMSPMNIMSFFNENYDMLKDKYGISNENINKFLSGLNKSNVLPYKAYLYGEGHGSSWGFFKNIDRYELGYDRERKPLYYRYYKDGTHDVLDKQTFEKEKYFNKLPENLKQQPKILIDEEQMSPEQRNVMYGLIQRHQTT